jgi:hypothetical protein
MGVWCSLNPGDLRDRNGCIITEWWSQEYILDTHFREEELPFEVARVQNESDPLCTGVHEFLLSLVCVLT